MSEKILITGASGFVGSFLVEDALDKGYEVYAGIRKSSSRKYLQDERIKPFFMDLSDQNQIRSALEKQAFDFIIQNAGITKAKSEDVYYNVNAYSLKTFVDSLIEVGNIPKKFISVSSLAAYGPADNKTEDIVHNNSNPQPVTLYGKSKLEGEKILKSYNDFPYTIVRPTAVYGPREMDLLTVYKMLKGRTELLIGSKPQKLTFIYVKDLVHAIMELLKIEKSQNEYFISDGNTYSAEQFNSHVKNELGVSTLKLRLPISLIRIIAIISEKISSLRGNYPALNLEKVNELECESWNCDISNLQEDINFNPAYSLEEGMKETIRWYKERKIL